MSHVRAWIASIEFDYEGEQIIGVFGSLDYAKSQLIARDTGDTQHVRLMYGPDVDYHEKRSPKYRRVPGKTTGFSSVKDGWLEWMVVPVS